MASGNLINRKRLAVLGVFVGSVIAGATVGPRSSAVAQVAVAQDLEECGSVCPEDCNAGGDIACQAWGAQHNCPSWHSAAGHGCDGITLETATYGEECGKSNNAYDWVYLQVNGYQGAQYTVSVEELGDPCPDIAKSFTVQWRCGNDPQQWLRSARLEAEANGKTIYLSCL